MEKDRVERRRIGIVSEHEVNDDQSSRDQQQTGKLYRIARQLLWLGARQKYRVFTSQLGLKQEYKGSILESYFTPFHPQHYIHIIRNGFEFCRVCSKWLWNWRRLSLHFRDGRKVVLISNNSYSHPDIYYKEERL